MSQQRERERVIEQQEARVLREAEEVQRGIDVRAIAARLTDEERNGKPGTVRNWIGALIACVSRAIEQGRARARQREQARRLDSERYADLWVSLLSQAAQQQASPLELAATLRTFRANGFPLLNPRVADKLDALGHGWPVPVLTSAPKPETTGPAQKRRTREGRSARADVRAG